MNDSDQPIVIRKVVKKGGKHGGSWKVALADFATAMMAFFLALWILGMTDEKQRGAISEYFRNPSRIKGQSDIPTNNPVQGPGGAMNSIIELEASALTSNKQDPSLAPPYQEDMDFLEPESIKELAAEQERLRMEELKEELKGIFKSSPQLSAFSDQMLIDIVPEGLRIQIIDEQKRPMFDLGSDKLKSYARKILEKIATTINVVPNNITITGHTDAHQYTNLRSYTNWELSADRANSARRALISGGLNDDKIEKVVGRGSSAPLHVDDPYAPGNRRISIIVLNNTPTDIEPTVSMNDEHELDSIKHDSQ